MNCSIALYKKILTLQDATFSQIEHEDAIIATVYKVLQANGTELILKICSQPNHYFSEAYFLNYFAGKLPVPRIVNLVEPEANIPGAILMEYFPGHLLKKTDLTNMLVYEIGSLLAKIHANKVEAFGDMTQANNLSPDPRHYFTFKFEEGLAECSALLPIKLIKQCRHFHDTHIDLLLSVDGPCITHRDFRPGNVIVNEGKIQGIIDWAGARASFAEEDFCPFEFGEWSLTDDNKKSFLAGYESIRPVPDYANVMPLLKLSRAIAVIGFTAKSGTWNNKNASLYQRNRKFLEILFEGDH